MASNKHNNIWKIMKEFTLVYYGEVNSELICTICRKVMIKACNGPCGCRYCWDCIVNYLDCKGKTCPTGLNECCGEIINADKNIQMDQPINMKISKLIVKCPQKSCTTKCELRMIEDHMEICKECLIQCPYHEMGCSEDKVAFYKIKDHLTVKDYSHAKLMIDSINNLKNEMSLLKNDIVNQAQQGDAKILGHINLKTKETDIKIMNNKKEIEMSISKLKDNLNNVTVMLKNQVEEIEKINFLQIKTIQANQTGIDLVADRQKNLMEFERLDKKICSLQDSNESLLRVLESVKLSVEAKNREKESEMSKLFQYYCSLVDENVLFKKEIESLKNTSHNPNILVSELQDRVEKVSSLITQSNLDYIDSGSTVSTERTADEQETSSGSEDNSDDDSEGSEVTFGESIKKQKSKLRLLEEKIETLELNLNSSKEFIWVIENLSEKRRKSSEEKIVYSEPFFSHQNGYKLRLHIYPRGKDGTGKVLSVAFSIVKGTYDDILRWPFKHDVIISLIDQSTGENYKTKTSLYKNSPRNHAWKKPVREVNNEKCFWNFIPWNDIGSNPCLCSLDRIFIKCLVKLNDY